MRKVKCTNFTIRIADISFEINLTLIARMFDEVKQEVLFAILHFLAIRIHN